jgi:hypothetical protein
LEEEEGALDDGSYDVGDDCGPCSPKEGTETDSRSNSIQPKGRLFFRDGSILSTTESVETLPEEDEVV